METRKNYMESTSSSKKEIHKIHKQIQTDGKYLDMKSRLFSSKRSDDLRSGACSNDFPKKKVDIFPWLTETFLVRFAFYDICRVTNILPRNSHSSQETKLLFECFALSTILIFTWSATFNHVCVKICSFCDFWRQTLFLSTGLVSPWWF